MARYLVVAHQTATSSLVIERLSRMADEDAKAQFTLLVPATHPKHLVRREEGDHLFVWDERETYEIASQRAEEARERLDRAGLRVSDAVVGDDSPLLAIEDLLRSDPGGFDGIVLSTLPLDRSRWDRMNLRDQAERRFGIPILHVCEGREDAQWSQPEAVRARARSHLGRLLPTLTGRHDAALVATLALVYLVSTAFLALAVDRRFFVNDALALTIFAIFFASLFLIERSAPLPRAEGGGGERDDHGHDH